jgi:hypothetical protein
MTAHQTVMGNMYVCHYPVVITNNRFPTTLGSTPVNRTIFPDDITGTNLKDRIFPLIFFILGIIAN